MVGKIADRGHIFCTSSFLQVNAMSQRAICDVAYAEIISILIFKTGTLARRQRHSRTGRNYSLYSKQFESLKSKHTKKMAEQHQVIYRDAFLGSVQKHQRVLQAIRFPLVISICRPSTQIPVSALKTLLQALYCDRGTIVIVAESGQKIMVMFSNDEDARNAYEELHGQTVSDGNGPVLRFQIWNPMDDLGYDVADHHVYVSIEGLPMHLWKEDVIEQVLHPFAALEHVSEETASRRNLSSCTAFAWSQKRIAMPRRISLKITKEASGDNSINDNEHYKEILVYNLLIEATGFLCDTSTECSCNLEGLNVRYEVPYDPDNAQCFLTEVPDNKDLLEELSYAVVATSDHEDHGYQREEMQDMVSSYLGCDMQVHRINETQFIIFPPNKSVGLIAKEILLEKGTFEMSLTEFKLDTWKVSNMAIVERLPVKVSITLNEIPAHLCTPKIVRFVLSPYCAVENTAAHAETMITSERFSCAAWTDSARKIPTRIMAALFSTALDEEDMGDGYRSVDLRITQLIVETTVVQAKQLG